MKLIVLLMFILGSARSMYGQAPPDEGNVLQKCFSLEELNKFYPRQHDGSLAPLQVLQHGVSFSGKDNISYQGKQVHFVEKHDIAGKADATYFLFHELQIGTDVARVSFAYYNGTEGVVVVELLLEKDYTDWNVVQSKIDKR